MLNTLNSSGGKSTENLYLSTSTVTLLKYYSVTSKSSLLVLEKYLSKSIHQKKFSEYLLLLTDDVTMTSPDQGYKLCVFYLTNS